MLMNMSSTKITKERCTMKSSGSRTRHFKN
jgi:hypothetical protein